MTEQSRSTAATSLAVNHGTLTLSGGGQFSQPLGSLSVNVGAEYRQESFNFSPDYIFGNGLTGGSLVLSVKAVSSPVVSSRGVPPSSRHIRG